LTPPHPHASHPPLKKGRPLHSMTWLLIGCMDIVLAATIFDLDL
jgi:hypothetical protein